MTKNRGKRTEEITIALSEPADNAQVVIAARRLAAEVGFSETDEFLIATAISELATNIIRHANKGHVIMRIVREGEREGIEIVAEDDGPGIENLSEAIKEHYSTKKSLGLGLPSVKRIMDEFTIDSEPGVGTKAIARKWR